MAGIATFALTGCGGGGHGGGGGSTDTANVAVSLPSGFPIATTDLVAGTSYGTGAVSGGAFKAKVSASGPTFAYLQQKSTGAYVMFGLVGHGRPGLSALSSAALAVALALGITALPTKGLTSAMALLETDQNVETLANAIAATMAGDPLCLTNGNTTIIAAIKTAVDAVAAEASPSAVQANPKTTQSTLVLVQPTSDQGGAEVLLGDDQASLVPTNTKRRPISAYTYLTGHVDANGTTTTVSPATRIDEQDLTATSSLLGSITSLGVKGAFGPVSGKPFELSVTSGDTKTLYETVVLMATGDNSAVDPAFFSDAKYANEVAGWRTQLQTLNLSAFVGGILFDLFNSVLAGAATAASATQVAAAITALEAAEASAANGILSAARLGQYGDAAQFLLTRLTANDLLATTRYKYRQAILEIIGESEAAAAVGAEGAAGIAVTGLAAVALAALTAAGTLAGIADVAASYFDTLSSPKGEIWTATAIKPSVVISPVTGTVSPGGSLTLTAATPGVSETNFKFRWTLSTGGNGNIGDPAGAVKPGYDVTTAGNAINLLTASSDAGGTIYTVTVAAIDLKDGNTLGTAKATLAIGNLDSTESGAFFTTSGPNPEDPVAGAEVAYAYVKFNLVPGATTYTLVVDDPNWPFKQQVKFAYASQLPTKNLDGTVVGNAILIQLDQTRPAGPDSDGLFTTPQAIADLTQQFSGYNYRVEATSG